MGAITIHADGSVTGIEAARAALFANDATREKWRALFDFLDQAPVIEQAPERAAKVGARAARSGGNRVDVNREIMGVIQ